MTRTISSKLGLIGLSLMLTACAQHGPRQVSCFTFRDTPARAAASTTTVSTMGAAVSRRGTACDFVTLGAGD